METIDKFIDYLSHEKKYSFQTIRAYKKDIESFATFYKKEYNLSIDHKDIEYNSIRTWIIYLSNNGISNRSINRKISSLKSYYKFLLQLNLIDSFPLKRYKPLKENKEFSVPFSKKEMEDFFGNYEYKKDYPSFLSYIIIDFLYSTGVRLSELITIKMNSVDFINNQITVLGKRNKERIIPLLPNIVSLLKEYIIQRNEIENSASTDYLFITPKGNKLYSSYIYKIVNELLGSVSSKKKKSPHILRHTFASHLLNKGADLNSIKDLLGHSSLSSTQYYTHNSIEKIQKMYEKTHPREINE